MFGMGTTMSVEDFYGVIKMPKGVFVGLLCQFSIMPLVGYGLSVFFDFPPKIAAGIILIGSCPGGLASNVMAYLAKANVALSISLTYHYSTIGPPHYPCFNAIFAGTLIPIDTWAMMISILKMVILPVVLGLIFNQLLKKRASHLLAFYRKSPDCHHSHHYDHHSKWERCITHCWPFALLRCNNSQCSRLSLRVLGL